MYREEYRGTQRGTERYREIQRYREVQRDTERYREAQRDREMEGLSKFRHQTPPPTV